MAESHLYQKLMRAFLANQLSREETGLVIRHLLSWCPACCSLFHQIVSEHLVFPKGTQTGPMGVSPDDEELGGRAAYFSAAEIFWNEIEKLPCRGLDLQHLAMDPNGNVEPFRYRV